MSYPETSTENPCSDELTTEIKYLYNKLSPQFPNIIISQHLIPPGYYIVSDIKGAMGYMGLGGPESKKEKLYDPESLAYSFTLISKNKLDIENFNSLFNLKPGGTNYYYPRVAHEQIIFNYEERKIGLFIKDGFSLYHKALEARDKRNYNFEELMEMGDKYFNDKIYDENWLYTDDISHDGTRREEYGTETRRCQADIKEYKYSFNFHHVDFENNKDILISEVKKLFS